MMVTLVALTTLGAPFRLSSQNEFIASRYYVDPEGRGVMIFDGPRKTKQEFLNRISRDDSSPVTFFQDSMGTAIGVT